MLALPAALISHLGGSCPPADPPREGEFPPADTNWAGASPGRLGTELERPQVTRALRRAVAVPEVLRKHRSCCVFQGVFGGASAGLFLSELCLCRWCLLAVAVVWLR